MPKERVEVDVLIVGAGPAGLAAAIRLKQLDSTCNVLLIDKGAEVGTHILSGAVFDPKALEELLPNWQALDAPLDTPVIHDHFSLLTAQTGWRLPHILLPSCFRNDDCYIISLGTLCRWLAEQAEAAGVDVFPGFAATEILYGEHGRVAGVITGDKGIGREGQATAAYQPGMELRARYTLFAEGCRGHLGQELEQHFALRDSQQPQVYSLGIKELWKVPAEQHMAGLALHTAGWPLGSKASGGGFCYHMEGEGEEKLLAVGLVVGLGYTNPWLSPFEEFQRYKTHPHIAAMLSGGTRIGYGARTLVNGGVQGLPRLSFPGGVLIGDEAGFLVAARQKGAHTAMKSGMLAAEAIIHALTTDRSQDELLAYPEMLRSSWIYDELNETRNFKPWLEHGIVVGGLMFGLEQLLLGGKAPWTLALKADHEKLLPAAACPRLAYPPPDGKLSFDLSSSLFLSGTQHAENQPCHLRLTDPDLATSLNLPRYAAPEQRYCPAGVYEILPDAAGSHQLVINAQNCLHCKACDIKDPSQNIRWLAPQGGEGPHYSGM